MIDNLEDLIGQIEGLREKIERLEVQEQPRWKYLSSPLTSTSWDGDNFSTTAKTKIDLSVVFGVPAGAKAVLVTTWIADSGSAGQDCWLLLAPNASAYQGFFISCGGLANGKHEGGFGAISCDANGDIYYQIIASGSGTMTIYLQIWGYMI